MWTSGPLLLRDSHSGGSHFISLVIFIALSCVGSPVPVSFLFSSGNILWSFWGKGGCMGNNFLKKLSTIWNCCYITDTWVITCQSIEFLFGNSFPRDFDDINTNVRLTLVIFVCDLHASLALPSLLEVGKLTFMPARMKWGWYISFYSLCWVLCGPFQTSNSSPLFWERFLYYSVDYFLSSIFPLQYIETSRLVFQFSSLECSVLSSSLLEIISLRNSNSPY